MIVIWLWNSSERGLTPLKAFLMMHQFQQMSQTKRHIKDAAVLLVQKSIALNGGLRCSYGSRKPEGLVNFENVYVKRGLEWLNLWVHHWICRHQSLIRCHFWGGLKSWTWVGNKDDSHLGLRLKGLMVQCVAPNGMGGSHSSTHLPTSFPVLQWSYKY